MLQQAIGLRQKAGAPEEATARELATRLGCAS
jgi:hypothetical protein